MFLYFIKEMHAMESVLNIKKKYTFWAPLLIINNNYETPLK